MSLVQTLRQEINLALKARDSVRLISLRQILSALQNKAIEVRRELSESDELLVLNQEAKKRREAIEEYQKAGREELVGKERYELDLIAGFLPEQMSDDEIRMVVRATIEKLSGAEIKAGPITGQVLSKISNRAGGGRVAAIVAEELKS